MPILDSCCRCCSLKTGTIVSGFLGIIIALSTLIVILITKVKMKTIVMDTLHSDVVKIILAVNLAMTVLISTLLIVGALKRNRWMMLPWVILAIILAIGLLVSVIYTSVEFYIHKDILNGTLWLVLGLIAVAIYTYLWLVVFSYYQLITQEKNRGPYGRPMYQYHR
ncbi:UNVERIFIED_CONTAM: hypothetical protein PYX00_000395 [Menopon gallinae]|uniref:Lysosomal-associated transmembrane protein 4B n=1 Tax=Menopon gallinae TaxID=328185 RepID=A0AAW2I933_9NEOP